MRFCRSNDFAATRRRVALGLGIFCALIGVVGCFGAKSVEAAAPDAKIVGDWRVETTVGGRTVAFDVAPPTWKTIVDEKIEPVPTFAPTAPPWMKGRVLLGVNACECAVFGALDPASVAARLASTGEKLERGRDFEFDDSTGALGRLDGGKIPENGAVLVDYRCVESRIDSIVCDADGELELVSGEPRVLSPIPPTLKSEQKRLVNVYLSGQIERLSSSALFPIDEAFANAAPDDAQAFCVGVDRWMRENGSPSPATVSDVGAAKKFLPKTWKKLTEGDEVRILAWGDSVTACGFLPDSQRWQIKFVERLQAMFPQAKIELITEAWGGRSSDSYRAEPAGSPKNYREKVLALKPDLIISEFVNDAFMDESTVARRYGEMRDDFQKIGAEWLILGPHYVRPDWMGLASERDVDDDPRPLVKGLRAFAAENDVPFADAPALYGKLWRAGIPYLTLMTNNINHPNEYGMELFAVALARLFEE